MKTKTRPGVRNSVSLSDSTKAAMSALLNARLADTLDLYTQLKVAHWNVKGLSFHQLHLLFDSFAEHVLEHADTLAERVTALGGRADGTARQAAAASSLPEYPQEAVNGMDHLEAVVKRLAAQANALRAAIDTSDQAGDAVTADVFTQLAREMDKDLWFAEAHLQAP